MIIIYYNNIIIDNKENSFYFYFYTHFNAYLLIILHHYIVYTNFLYSHITNTVHNTAIILCRYLLYSCDGTRARYYLNENGNPRVAIGV